MARWLRAKLALRDGQDGAAARLFADAVQAYPAEPGTEVAIDWASGITDEVSAFSHQQFQADFGTVQLARADYQQALTSLLRSGFWRDAAYVAEDVLTPDELIRYVREHDPQAPTASSPQIDGHDSEDRQSDVENTLDEAVNPQRTENPAAFSLRYLLARRLARLGRYPEARTFLLAALRPKFDQYVAARKTGESGAARAKRAAALWEAAKIERWLGLELFGTEVQPDWFVEDGEYEDDDYRQARLGGAPESAYTQPSDPSASPTPAPPFVPPVGAGEKRRVAKAEATPDARYHYRYLAAELSWKAAALMPDQADETAKVLATGGAWLRSVHDDDGADRFQRALVRRCGRTEIGQASEKSGGLPDVPHEEP